jgi:uncharacterized membrane protein
MGFLLVRDEEKKRLFVILLAFNPAMFSYILEGRSDMFMYPFLFLGFYLLHLKKYKLSSVPLALAFAIKQSAWPLLPLYLMFVFFKTNIKETSKVSVVLLITFLIVVLPFFVWNQKAFLDSTVFYLSGQTQHSYPISGYGFGMLLYEIGIIKNLEQYFPFTIYQFIFSVPVFVFLFFYMKSHRKVNSLITAYGLLLFVFWYFSRYFNNSHLGYLSLVFITSYFWPEKISS